MTEADWLAIPLEEPGTMLHCLYRQRKASVRKLRLYGAACLRRASGVLDGEIHRLGVAILEGIADGTADPELAALRALGFGRGQPDEADSDADSLVAGLLQGHVRTLIPSYSPSFGYDLLGYQLLMNPAPGGVAVSIISAALVIMSTAAAAYYSVNEDAVNAEYVTQGRLVRDIVGNPFGPAVTIQPDWLAWSGGVVRKLAEETYTERELPRGNLDGTRLAVLADALEEAGCADENVLGHLRSSGDHVRGCWAVDHLLGKE